MQQTLSKYLCAGLILGACTGDVGEAGAGLDDPELSALVGGDGATGPTGPAGGAGSTSPDAPSFTCDPDQEPAEVALRRLTRQQYENTLRDLLGMGLADVSLQDRVWQALAPSLDQVPTDVRARSAEDLHGSYRRLDQDVSQSHVDAWFAVAEAAGAALSRQDTMAALLGPCASDADASNDDACVDDFISNFGALVLRRPLQGQEASFYRGFYAATGLDGTAMADLITGLLSAPQFLYMVEHGDGAVAGSPDRHTLSPYELAARLSYHFWSTMPDAELLDRASDGSLLEAQEYAAQVERLLQDPRSRETTREFYRDWLKLEDLPALDANNDSPLFQAFAGTPLPSPDLRRQMIDEVLDLLQFHTWEQPAGLQRVMTSELSVTRDAELANLYGVSPWDGTGTPPSFPPDERPGLVTRAALLATGSPNTRPIMKGLFIRRNLLCDKIPPPPNNAAADTPTLSDSLSTRQVVEELTEQDGSACAGCHAVNINPLGFATEGFDALGRLRSEQHLFDDTGNPIGSVPVDTRSVLRVAQGDTRESTGPTDLARQVVESGKADACLARHYFRYSFGRFEDAQKDGCTLNLLHRALTDSDSLADMLKEVALAPAFKQRSFAP